MGRVVTSAFGAAAIDALSAALERGGDPLAPGLVVCPGPLVAVGVRRALGTRPGGIAGIEFVTAERLIEDLSQSRLADVGQHPASRLELQSALRAELASNPGLFGSVASHRTTEERLLQLDSEVMGLPYEEVRRLGAEPGLSGDAFRVLRGAAERLGLARVDSHQVHLALEGLDGLEPWSRGPLVVYLPEPLRPFEGRLFSALAGREDCTVIVGLSGHRDVDGRHLNRLAGWGRPGIESSHEVQPSLGRVLNVSDPEDEVRAAVRELVAHAASGTPLSRMALLYTASDPYASLITEHLTAAELPFSIPGYQPLSMSLAGRTLLRLIDLTQDGLERSAVITLLSSAPIVVGDGRIAPASQWDRLSRQAGVVDRDDWQPRIDVLAAGLEDDVDRKAAEALLAFIVDLDSRLHPVPIPSSWDGWATWALDLLGGLLRADSSWPERELVALERVQGVLSRLRLLDRVDPLPDGAAFAATVLGELESATIPGVPAGSGLMVAPLTAAAGLGFDRLAVVGLVEGTFPRSAREDSLLPDQVRAAARGMLLTKSELPAVDIRSISAVVSGARHEPLLTTSRGDLRSRRSRVWPRQLDHLADPERNDTIESHHRGLVDHGRPASLDDLGLRSLVRHVDGGDPVHTHSLSQSDSVLAAGLRRHLDRHRSSLTVHSGRVGVGLVDPTTRLLSPTALEDYASCPRKYLFGRVLRITEEERPERIDEITARDRGNLVHQILEDFVSDALVNERVPEPDVPWSSEDVDRLLEQLDQSIARAASQGITGGRVQTELLRRALRNEVGDFLETDNHLRSSRRSRPFAVELRFGFEPDEPGVVDVGDGRQLRMRGAVDRVDVTDDGGVLVIDYKGGSDRPFAKMADDPLQSGRRLQLPLYARIVADLLDRKGPRTALYWLTKHASLKEMELDDALEDGLDQHIAAALDGIGGGLFPGLPGATVGWPRLTFENCVYCDFDRICPTDRQREWDDVRDDDALTPIDRLLGRDRDSDDAAR